MQVDDVCDITIEDFFSLVESEGGVYEVETPQGWIEIGDLKREDKECYLLRTDSGVSLGAGHDHLVETQNGWEKVEKINIQQSLVKTRDGEDQVVAREYIGIHKTFDFEVLSNEHKYYANGVVSHNCGKTLTCKWLRSLCLEKGFEYKVVTFEIYRTALNRGTVSGLFRLNTAKKGVIFFDDMDVFFQDRNRGNEHLMTFLTELDGIDPVDGIIFIFTSNKIGEELDEAFVRPGRVDLFMKFRAPNKKLRKKFIKERFHKDILDNIDVDDVVERTGKQVGEDGDGSEGYSYAELEEIRKLLVFEHIAGRTPDVDRVFKLFEHHRKEFGDRIKLQGFGNKLDEGEDDEEDFYELFGESFDDSPFRINTNQ